MYNIPLFDLNFGKEEEDAVIDTLKSRWISTGPRCMEFEEKFADMLGAKYACAVANCTAALHLACCALEIKEGDEVICPSLTFAATVNCIRYVGATPIFADLVSVNDLCIDAEKLETLITDKTKAVIPMHYAGFPCNMKKIKEIARKYNLYIIEDACHGPLSEYEGRKLGTIGDIGCFSFFSNKNISTGEGGMLVTDQEEIARKVKLLRSHGMTTMSYQRASGHATSYDIIDIGFNYRMDDIHAAIGIAQLDKLKPDLEIRRNIRKWYIQFLSGNENLSIPFKECETFVSNYIFPIVLLNSTSEKRDMIRKRLQDQGIQTSVHYPAIHRFSAYRQQSVSLPITEYVTDNEITLPMYAKLTKNQVKYICDVLIDAIK